MNSFKTFITMIMVVIITVIAVATSPESLAEFKENLFIVNMIMVMTVVMSTISGLAILVLHKNKNMNYFAVAAGAALVFMVTSSIWVIMDANPIEAKPSLVATQVAQGE